MKNKFLKGVIATAVVALVAGYGISRSVNNSNAELTDLTLANLEALADGESEGIKTNKKDIFDKEKWQKYTMNLGEDVVKPSMYKNSCVLLNSSEMLLIGGYVESENIIPIYNIENQRYTSIDFWVEDNIPAEIIAKQLVYSSNSTIYKHPLENIFIYACEFGRHAEIFTINNNKIGKRNCFLSEKLLYYSVGLDFKIEKTEIDKPNG